MPRQARDPNAPAAPAPPTHGIDHIRTQHPDAMKIWTTKGAKDQGGTISGVLHSHGDGHRVSLLHQHDSGGFDVYERTHSGKPTPAGD